MYIHIYTLHIATFSSTSYIPHTVVVRGPLATRHVTIYTENDTGNLAISGPDVLRELGGVHPLHVCFLAILAFSRALAYLSLRFLHRS